MKAVIFDMDGVLIDSEKIWAIHEVEFVNTIAPGFSSKDHSKITGKSPTGTYAYLKEKYNLKLTKEEFLEIYKNFALEKVYPFSKISPHALEFIKYLQTKQIPMAIASSSIQAWIDYIVNKYELKKYFQAIVSADHIGGIGKPAPDIFLYTARQLNIKPKNCLVLEDSENGVIAGKNAGMTTYGYKNGYNEKQDLSQADKIFTNFLELKKIF